MPQPLIIYNLFPRLAGEISCWYSHVERAREMHFNVIFLNPIHYTGFSGSLYAIKDYYRFNPLFFPGKTEEENRKMFIDFVNYCHQSGLKVVIDLVINHTAKDSELTKTHKDWYVQKNGKIQSPGVWDGDKKTVEWGDLAEIDNEKSPNQKNLRQYWKDLISYYLEMGIDGFRCDAAYQVPNELWEILIRFSKKKQKNCLFLAESLGCTIEETTDLIKAGFDYVFNSTKYWDFNEDWALDQNELIHQNKGRSISFPESHDTVRIASEYKGDIQQAKLRYLFAAVYSSGVMIPCGFEFGFKKKTDVIRTTPEDWEEGLYDLTEYIRRTNEIKLHHPILQEDSEIRRINDKYNSVLALLKISRDLKSKLLIFLNKDQEAHKRFYHSHLHALMQSSQIEDISPENVMFEEKPNEMEYWLHPGQIKVFHSALSKSPKKRGK